MGIRHRKAQWDITATGVAHTTKWVEMVNVSLCDTKIGELCHSDKH